MSFRFWVWLPLLIVLSPATVLILLLGLDFLLLGVSELKDTWDEARLKTEMERAGIALPTSLETNSSDLSPKIISVSPDQKWTVTTSWNLGDLDYDWAISDNTNGHVYPQRRIQEKNCCRCPSQMLVLWSPDSHYAAVTAFNDKAEHMSVISLDGSNPQYIGASPRSASIENQGVQALDKANHLHEE